MVSKAVQLLYPKLRMHRVSQRLALMYQTTKQQNLWNLLTKALLLPFPLKILSSLHKICLNVSFQGPKLHSFKEVYNMYVCRYTHTHTHTGIYVCIYFKQFRLHSTSQAFSGILNILLNANKLAAGIQVWATRVWILSYSIFWSIWCFSSLLWTEYFYPPKTCLLES